MRDPYHWFPPLNKWALFAYLFHEFFNRIFPRPFGAWILLFFAPIFILIAYYIEKSYNANNASGGSQDSNASDQKSSMMKMLLFLASMENATANYYIDRRDKYEFCIQFTIFGWVVIN